MNLFSIKVGCSLSSVALNACYITVFCQECTVQVHRHFFDPLFRKQSPHGIFCYFFAVEVIFLQQVYLQKFKSQSGEADYMTESSFFALTCLKLKSLLHTISLKISFIIIFIYYCLFCVKVNYVGRKILSCTASGGIKLE